MAKLGKIGVSDDVVETYSQGRLSVTLARGGKTQAMKTVSWLRRIAHVSVVRPLKSAGVKPALVAAVRLGLGTLAAVLLAIGPGWFSVGAAVFLIAIFVDRTERELAQSAGQVSPTNDRSDLFNDGVSNALAFAGLGLGLRASDYGLAAVGMGVIAGIAVAVVPWLVRRVESIDEKPSAEFSGVAGIDADDVMLFVPIALWAGWAEGLLAVVAFGAPAFACAFFTTHYRKLSSG